MRLSPTLLAADLGRTIQPIYCLCGDAPLLVDEAAAQIRHALDAVGAERTTLEASGQTRWGEFFSQFDGLSLFAQQRLIEVRLPAGKPGIEGAKALEAWAKNPAPDCTLVLVLPQADKTMQGSKWFSALDALGVVVIIPTPTLEQLPQWIGERLARHQLKADRATLDWLAIRVEGNLLAAHQEIEKLALLLPPGTLTLEAARAAVTDVARFDAADLSDALWRGDAARFIRIIDSLKAEGETPIFATFLLAQDLRALYRLALAAARGENLAGLMNGLRVWGARQTLFTRHAQRLGPVRLGAALQHAGRIDRNAKGLAKDDAWNLFKQLGLGLLNKPAPAFSRALNER
jgi:DNA polymerase III subunit delta